MAAFLSYLKNYKKEMRIKKMFRETILYKMGRGKFLYYSPPFVHSTITHYTVTNALIYKKILYSPTVIIINKCHTY
jgi:trehalose utilization protein